MAIDIGLSAAIGFIFAAYAVVGNDALQTLGTFINSNRKLPWWALYLFAASILIIVFLFGYVTDGGELTNADGSPRALCDFSVGCDPSYGRLSNTEKFPVFEPQWYHAVPPLVLLILTRLGIPVSTSFMVLASFATMAGLQSMLEKSVLGYVIAFFTGGIIYVVLAPTLERWFLKTADRQRAPIWVLLQWLTTGYLWSVWLMQDMANIFIFLPRGDGVTPGSGLNPAEAGLALAALVLLLGYTFWNGGGPVQKVLRSKTSVTDIRSATIIDFTYACLLFYFKELNDYPMSTTWVFLGLIAGREFAIATLDKIRSVGATARIVGMDAAKALTGLVISVVLALSLEPLAQALSANFGIG